MCNQSRDVKRPVIGGGHAVCIGFGGQPEPAAAYFRVSPAYARFMSVDTATGYINAVS